MGYVKQIFLSLAASLVIVSCGGGSGGGASQAEITDENAKSLAIAGTEVAKSASASDDIGFPGLKSNSTSGFDLRSFSKQIASQAYAIEDLGICSSGTGIVNISDSSTESNYSGSVAFTNCVIVESFETVTINGTMTFRGTSSSVTVTANLTVTENGVTETISFSSSCASSRGVVNEGSCTYALSVSGIDGRTYSTSNIKVSGDEFSGYSVSGSVTDPDYGVVTIVTSVPVLFNCTNGNPSAGEITVAGSNGSLTVTYNSCDSFTVTYNDVGSLYNWSDIEL